MSNLQELIEIVRASRERTNGVFPLPDVDSCIDYAVTEAGEHLDAVLRERRNGDKRKHRNSQGQACNERSATATGSGTHEEHAQAG